MTPSPAIVWFRRDLRLVDNPALHAGLRNGSLVIPVFIWAPEEEAPWAPGSASRWWLHQSLRALRESLRRLGSDLIIRRGSTPEVLLSLTAESGAKSVYWNRLYEPCEIARGREVKQALREKGIAAESFESHLLFEPGTILNSSGRPFTVFTAFWNACQRAPAPPAPLPAARTIPPPSSWPHSLEISGLGLEPTIDWAAGIRQTWSPGEPAAGDRLKEFLHSKIENYATERDRPDREGSSRLSPHLHFGEISPRQIWHAAQAAPARTPFLREIAWREFAHHVLFHFPHTPHEPLRPEFRSFPWRMDEKALRAWTRGKTGYPLVDAGMRQLWHTGWMHNRVRMVAASFLVKHLLIPWQEGGAWFWDTLVDADLANNTLGWQWVAGCGADAAPYFRIFNPALQAKKFDPDGAYVRRWIPELAKSPASYPPPIVIHETARKRALAAFQNLARVNVS